MTYTNKIEFKDGSRHQSEYLIQDYEISYAEFDAWRHNYEGKFKSIIMYCDGSCIKVEFSN